MNDTNSEKLEVADNTTRMIDLRTSIYANNYKSRKYIRITQAMMIVMIISVLIDAVLGSFRWWQSITLIFATFTLSVIYFYSLAEKDKIEALAGGLAMDLVLNLAMQTDEYLKRVPVIELERRGKSVGITLGYDERDVPLCNIANRLIADSKAKEGTWEVVEAGLPRIRPVQKIYKFTEEDIADIMIAMHQNPQLIEVYVILLRLIEASIEKEKETRKWPTLRRAPKTAAVAI